MKEDMIMVVSTLPSAEVASGIARELVGRAAGRLRQYFARCAFGVQMAGRG